MEDNEKRFHFIPSDVLPPGMVMLISPPTQREISEAGGNIAKAIINHNKIAAVDHIRPSSAD